jgi:hypothetical protein
VRRLLRAINLRQTGNREPDEDVVALKTVISRAIRPCILMQLAAVLMGCSEIGFGRQPEKTVDPNTLPENYKKDVLAYVQAHPGELINTRDASISSPALKVFGTESRYFVCLQANAPDSRKEKLVIFFSGRINQFIDAEGGQCSGAAYQPFPELLAELRHLKEKK